MTNKEENFTENAVVNSDIERPWLFQRGQSGNPAGKPKGTKHKATLAVMTLLENETQNLTRKAVELALEGDTAALKMCLDRLAPSLKPITMPINLDLPNYNSLADIARAFISAAAKGDVPPDIAAQLVSAVASVARVEELEQVKERLESLEFAIKEKRK